MHIYKTVIFKNNMQNFRPPVILGIVSNFFLARMGFRPPESFLAAPVHTAMRCGYPS